MPAKQKARQKLRLKNNDRLNFRLSSEAKRIIEQAAAASGQTVKQFAVSTLVQSAKDVLERHRTIHLSNRDRDLFLSLLDSDEQPNNALKDAAERFKRFDELELLEMIRRANEARADGETVSHAKVKNRLGLTKQTPNKHHRARRVQ